MAGYRRTGADTFINATTINDQIVSQRDDYREHNSLRTPGKTEFGIARDTSNLFPGWDPQDIIEKSAFTFSRLDTAVTISGNPDFGPGSFFNLFNADQTSRRSMSMYNDVDNQIDKPNEKGPNLIAPDINGSTFDAPNGEQQTTQFTERGFGWRDERNDPGTETARIGEYFSKHYKVDGEDLVKPVLGEAKSPTSDTNIDYDQP